jgi:hypothetical protein
MGRHEWLLPIGISLLFIPRAGENSMGFQGKLNVYREREKLILSKSQKLAVYFDYQFESIILLRC